MKCQATKSHWIRKGRDHGAAALIIYLAEEECYCLEIKHSSNVSKAHDELMEQGYTVLEEIFL